jgi:hypothetical protein
MMKTLLIVTALAAASLASAQLTETASSTHYVASSASGSTTSTFDIESFGGGTKYAQFGVADFSFGTVADFNASSLTVSLTQYDVNTKYFYAPSGLTFSLSSFTGSTSGLRYQNAGGTDNLSTNNLDPTLWTSPNNLYTLGSGIVTAVANGTVDSYTFTLNSATQAFLKSQLAAGGDIRLLVAADESYDGAQYDDEYYFAGASNATAAYRPTITLTPLAVPEPMPMAVLGLGIFGMVVRRRTNR